MPKAKKSTPKWKPAKSFKVTKLERVGPKEDQTTDQYLYGKSSQDKRWDNEIRSEKNKYASHPNPKFNWIYKGLKYQD